MAVHISEDLDPLDATVQQHGTENIRTRGVVCPEGVDSPGARLQQREEA